jgi:anti-sigma B factor antagonist
VGSSRRMSRFSSPARPGAAPSSSPLAIETDRRAGVLVIVARGELDLSTAPALCSAIDRWRFLRRGERIVLDLTGVEFCDSTGLRALIGSARELAIDGGRLITVIAPDGPVRRLVTLTATDEMLAVAPSLERALGAVGSRR